MGPAQYKYMMPVYISHNRETRSLAVFNDLELSDAEFDDLPFHIFTMLGKTTQQDRPTTMLFKVDRKTGGIQSLQDAANYWPDLSSWSLARTFIGDTVQNELWRSGHHQEIWQDFLCSASLHRNHGRFLVHI